MNTYPKEPVFKDLNSKNIGVDQCSGRLNLTINVILDLNNIPLKILEIQNDILEGLSTSSNVCSGVYKYPKHTLHFSVIDFLDF